MWKKRIFFTRTTSEISFSNAEKRGHRIFHWYGTNLILLCLQKGSFELKKAILARITYTQKGYRMVKLTQFDDKQVYPSFRSWNVSRHSIFPPSLVFPPPFFFFSSFQTHSQFTLSGNVFSQTCKVCKSIQRITNLRFRARESFNFESHK